MRFRTLLLAFLALALLAGCRSAAQPSPIKVETHPLRMAGGWAVDVRFVNTAKKVQVLTIADPAYTMTILNAQGNQVFRREGGEAYAALNLLPGSGKAYPVSWRGVDAAGERVPAGTYTVKLDFNATHEGRKIEVPDQQAEIK